MNDISREKLEVAIDAERDALCRLYEAHAYGIKKFASRLKIFMRDGELDADPWIPVSTPPEEMVRVLGYSKETGDYYAVKYQGELLGWSMPGTCGISIDYYQYITPPVEE